MGGADMARHGAPDLPGQKELSSLLDSAKRGSAEARNELMRKYTPFVLGVASKLAGRYIDLEEDDEASVALLGLSEAIEAFDPCSGAFLSFVRLVVKRRLLDFWRKSRTIREIPMSSLPAHEAGAAAEGMHPGAGSLIEAAPSPDEIVEEKLLAVEDKGDVVGFVKDLLEYGVSVKDLVAESPRHADTRKMQLSVASDLARDQDMSGYLLQEKKLPLKMLSESSGLSRKTLERHRKYLIALGLAFSGRYPFVRRYLSGR